MKYNVHIEEMLEKDVLVEAETSTDACSIVEEKISNGEIVLSADDFSGWRFVKAKKYGD
jgi:hypothetical protein